MEFSLAIGWLVEHIGIPVGSAYRQPRRKDGGVDIVAWRPFEDGRPGVPILLVQATVQSDVISKARDVDLRMWSGWLGTDIDPLVVLAIPGSVSKGEAWNEISRHCLLLDRTRLVDLAPEVLLTEFSQAEELVDLVRTQTRDWFINSGAK